MPTITPVRKDLSIDRLVKTYYGSNTKPTSWHLFLINNPSLAGASAMNNWDTNSITDATILNSEVPSINGYSRQPITWTITGTTPITIAPTTPPQLTASGGSINFTHYGIVDNNGNIEMLADAYSSNNNSVLTINDGETYVFNLSSQISG